MTSKHEGIRVGVATALAAGCTSLVCFMDSMLVMSDLVDLSPHSGQGSSLAACAALHGWFSTDAAHTLHLWHVPSKEWKVHHEAHKVVKATQIPLCPGCKVLFDFVHVVKEALEGMAQGVCCTRESGLQLPIFSGLQWEAAQTHVIQVGGCGVCFWPQGVTHLLPEPAEPWLAML